MAEVVTVPAKHIFLDIVGFTHNRSVEAQTEIIGALNVVVLSVLSKVNISSENRIILPTGDGICLALLNLDSPYDLHIQLALSLIEGIEKHNADAKDEQRKFKIRIGINSNVDNLVTDVNGNRNIAGAGINLAQRVMSTADGNQLLVGQPVFDTLSQREKYMHAFRPYTAIAKHGLTLNVYQLVIDGFPGLDINTPTQFREESPRKEKIREVAAYYMAHAMVHRAEIVSGLKWVTGTYTPIVLLWMLANDSLDAAHANEYEPSGPTHAYQTKDGFAGQLEFYEKIDFQVRCELASFIALRLKSATDLFENGLFIHIFGALFVTPEGQKKLKKDWPRIWEGFHLEDHANLES